MYKKLILLTLVTAFPPTPSFANVQHVDFIGSTIVLETTDGFVFKYNLSKAEMKLIADPVEQDKIVNDIIRTLNAGKLPANQDPNLRK
jgi:hypothetical protein